MLLIWRGGLLGSSCLVMNSYTVTSGQRQLPGPTPVAATTCNCLPYILLCFESCYANMQRMFQPFMNCHCYQQSICLSAQAAASWNHTSSTADWSGICGPCFCPGALASGLRLMAACVSVCLLGRFWFSVRVMDTLDTTVPNIGYSGDCYEEDQARASTIHCCR
jgi:hypothetical protein